MALSRTWEYAALKRLEGACDAVLMMNGSPDEETKKGGGSRNSRESCDVEHLWSSSFQGQGEEAVGIGALEAYNFPSLLLHVIGSSTLPPQLSMQNWLKYASQADEAGCAVLDVDKRRASLQSVMALFIST